MPKIAFPKIIGHRGAAAYAPENTLASFRKAKALGALWVEFDVMLAACGTPIVFHDHSLERITKVSGNVCDFIYAELEKLDAGAWFDEAFRGEKIPRFEDVIACLGSLNLRANIEIKPAPGSAEKTTHAVIALIRQLWPKHMPDPLISSFETSCLVKAHALAPELPLGWVMSTWQEEALLKASSLHCVSVHCPGALLTQFMVERIHEQKQYVLAYTINDKNEAHALLQLGVDALFSDHPDLLA